VPLLCALADAAEDVRAALEDRARCRAADAGRRDLLREGPATFPYLVEALRGGGPPLTARAYGSLRAFLAAGRVGRRHRTPGGEVWELQRGDGVRVTRTTSRPRST